MTVLLALTCRMARSKSIDGVAKRKKRGIWEMGEEEKRNIIALVMKFGFTSRLCNINDDGVMIAK